MKIGVIGLGRMGGNITRRLIQHGHEVVAWDRSAEAVADVAKDGATGAGGLDDMRAKLGSPATFWVMLPAGDPTESTIAELAEKADKGDVIIDGGNTFYKDDIRRAKKLREKGIHYIDVGTSGGVWGLERGYCMMIGGPDEEVRRLDPIFEALAPGIGTIPRTTGRDDGEDPRAEKGYIHAGPAGAGHFVKMVHNGIEYGLMQAYAEGFDVLKGKASDKLPEDERFDINLTDVAEVWRRGSVISSWLLDLSAAALAKDQMLEQFSGHVADSGEGHWTIEAAMEEAVPANVLTAALFARYRSRVEHTFGDKLLSAMRFGFGGHVEIPAMIDHVRLVVSDLDGTLVDSDKQLTPATIAAVRRLRAGGISFAVISARPRSGVLPIVEQLGLEGEQAAFNGGTIFRGDGSVVERHTVDEAVVRGMFELTRATPVEPWMFADDRWYAQSGTGLHADRERKSSNQEPVVTGDFAPLYGDVDKLTFVSDDEALLRSLHEQAVARFGTQATIVQSQVYYLDVTPLAGNKGDGIRALARSRDVPLDRVVAIGDQANDLPMIEQAGFGIAMGNAPDAVQQKADAVTAGNDDDGVAKAIDTMILKGTA